jgi:hypothetical protein
VVAGVAGLSGLSVWRHAELFDVSIGGEVAHAVPVERHRQLLVVACYHFTAYATSLAGGVVLCFRVVYTRRRQRRAAKLGVG